MGGVHQVQSYRTTTGMSTLGTRDMERDKEDGIIKSPYPDERIPDLAVDDFVRQLWHSYGDRVALEDPVKRTKLTYSQLGEGIDRLVVGLQAIGVRQGDVVAVFSPNSCEYVLLLFAVLKLRAVVSTINPAYTKGEVAKQITINKAKFVYTTEELCKSVLAAKEDIPAIKEIIVLGNAPQGCQSWTNLTQFSVSGQLTRGHVKLRQDMVIVPFSSGTTGMSKGVVLTHYNLVAAIISFSIAVNTGPVVLSYLPFYHIYGMIILCTALYQGRKQVVMAGFQPHFFCQAIQDNKISLLFLVPPTVLFIAKSPIAGQYDLSSVQKIYCGAAPLGKELEKEVSSRMKNAVITQGWGMTETSGTGTSGFPVGNRSGSVGKPVPNVEIKIVNVASGKTAKEKEEGEVWIRGPMVMRDYLDNPAATKATLTPDRWLKTGDLGYYDTDGFIYVVDRLKELIKYKGFQVAPAELEALLLTHPAVADATVIGVPDTSAGEVAKAFVVLKPAAVASVQDIHSHVNKNVAPFKRLYGGIEFVESIPKSPSGKILRRELRKRARTSKL